ncbi:hypothetical protein HND72_11345 [Pseudomonas putida]|uniref:SWIM zinc finger family protein n=1 Tax=Pseudomonas TaxID=286 RepID=UPI0011AF4068|nr:hypothetical protein [Pseudomonas putida]HDS0995395.1 SWIM zinc finger family protein [Pseudomonas putida]HDS1762681.1 SWIM zinc finger family protein [Pseudomonas putida]
MDGGAFGQLSCTCSRWQYFSLAPCRHFALVAGARQLLDCSGHLGAGSHSDGCQCFQFIQACFRRVWLGPLSLSTEPTSSSVKRHLNS